MSTRPARRPRPSARSHLLTVLGEYALPTTGGLWSATAIEALGRLGFSQANVRQALSRLATDGLLAPQRRGRRARWVLTAEGRRLLTEGADRIYRFGDRRRTWDGHWLLVLCPVPESQRAVRRRYQTRMAFAGFGILAPGVAVSPHRAAADEARRILDDLGLAEAALVLTSETVGTVSDRLPDHEILARAWDLAELSTAYSAFLREFSARLPTDPGPCFDDLTALVHAWRRFPFADPEVPDRLLDADWPGLAAERLFTDRRAAWRDDAVAWFLSREADHGERPGDVD